MNPRDIAGQRKKKKNPTKLQTEREKPHHGQAATQLVLHQVQQGVVAADVVSPGLQGHGQQTQPHVNHHVRVVPIQGVGQGDQEAEQLTHAWQPVGD